MTGTSRGVPARASRSLTACGEIVRHPPMPLQRFGGEAGCTAAGLLGVSAGDGDHRAQLRQRELANLAAHVFSDLGREAIVEAGIDAGVRDLFVVIP